MPDDPTNDALDSWAQTEQLASRPLPSAVAERLGTIRLVRRGVLVGAGAAIALVLLALGSTRTPQNNQAAPPPTAPAPVIDESAPAPTIGEIYSLNDGLRGESEEIELPPQPSLDWANEDPLSPE